MRQNILTLGYRALEQRRQLDWQREVQSLLDADTLPVNLLARVESMGLRSFALDCLYSRLSVAELRASLVAHHDRDVGEMATDPVAVMLAAMAGFQMRTALLARDDH